MSYLLLFNCPNDEQNDKKWLIDEFEKHTMDYVVIGTKLYNSSMCQTKKGYFLYFFRMYLHAIKGYMKSKPGDILIVWSRYVSGIINSINEKTGNNRIIFSRVWDSPPSVPSRMNGMLRKQLMNRMCRITVQTEFDKKRWLKEFNVKDIGNIYIMPETYDTNIEFRKPMLKCGKERYVFCGGRGNRDWKKAVDIAFSMPDTNFKYIAYKYDWDKKVERVPPNVEIIFNTTPQKYIEYMENAYIIMLPIVSNKKVGGQLNILMAAQLGIPCMINDELYSRIYYPEECKDFLMDDNINTWINEIKYLYTCNEKELLQKLEIFQSYIRENFGPEKAYQDIIEITSK